ncbi:olfactory receptor 6M1-like [Rhinatrema bivittatum]|uniref:olfactory receptor 6M1-like n=1 Tax=Rhinatrema bivittatum TaxID=194408 RepID=UPI0011284645|nr:olfactory receptor 6M1-like [Rhinatrema bivittatum]
MEVRNQSAVSHFFLQGFPLSAQLQVCAFVSVLLIYMLSLALNIIIILITCLDYRLHTPMYMLLSNLAFQDMWFMTSTVLKMLICLAEGDNRISFSGCILQMYFYLSLGSTEFFILGIMSVDRYVAICYPLHYNVIMTGRRCIHFLIGCWTGGFLCFILPMVMTSMLPFCSSNIINHFFCDAAAVVTLACSPTQRLELLFFSIASTVILSSFLVTVISYIFIVTAILQIPSSSGRRKAFSTCASHFVVVTIVYGSCIFIYVTQQDSSSLDVTKIVAILNSVINPVLNPLIYTLRNKKIKDILRETVTKIFFKMRVILVDSEQDRANDNLA